MTATVARDLKRVPETETATREFAFAQEARSMRHSDRCEEFEDRRGDGREGVDPYGFIEIAGCLFPRVIQIGP